MNRRIKKKKIRQKTIAEKKRILDMIYSPPKEPERVIYIEMG